MFFKTLVLVSLLFCDFSLAQNSSKCSWSGSNIKASWIIVNGGIEIMYQNSDLKNNHWTGIAFGDTMRGMKIVTFTIVNDVAQIQTGTSQGISIPTFDVVPVANVELLEYDGSTLNAKFILPSIFEEMPVDQCNTWNFIHTTGLILGQIAKHSSKPDQIVRKATKVHDVCPAQCQ